MKGNFDRCLAEVLKHEGGFVNHSADPGGMTNLGVTKQTYEDWVGRPVTEKIMRGLTVGHVRTLYRKRYWDALKGDDLPVGLDLCVFDFGVNAGVNRAARYLQRLVGAKEDGQIGPVTAAAVREKAKEAGTVQIIRDYQEARNGYYRLLKTFPTFGRGWLRRVREVEAAATAMVRPTR